MIDKIPCYYKSHSQNDNCGKEHVFPFKLIYDVEMQMFRQIATKELNELLNEVYKDGSLLDGTFSSE